MDYNEHEYIWVEKYRPKTIDDCILPDHIKKVFQEFVDSKTIPTLMLTGGPGVGKTTVARALCEMTGCDYIIINGSEESGIDVLRTKIKDFASTVSFTGSRKIVIIDEADYLNPQSTQPALRGFIEQFSDNCGFIFTANWANRIISPIHSRCSVVEFKINSSDKPKLAAQLMGRISEILTEENIHYDKKVIAELIMKHFPDFRRCLNELQRYGIGGTIDVGILSQLSDVNMDELISALKEKNFKRVRSWVAHNIDNDPNKVFRKIYDAANDHFKPESIPQAVLILADYSYKAAFVSDVEINLVACLIELMVETEFK
jgi:DNA polymerase III delta prime subunit